MLTQKELELLEKYQIPEKVHNAFIECVIKIVSIFDDVGQEFEELITDEFFENHPETLSDDFSEEEYYKLREKFKDQKTSDILEWFLTDIKESWIPELYEDDSYLEKKYGMIKEKLKES